MNSPVLPESSPFSPEQRSWLNGFFAGLANSSANGKSSITGESTLHTSNGSEIINQAPSLPVLVLFGSQSGTTEGLAQALVDKLLTAGNPTGPCPRFSPRLLGMDHFKEIEWASETTVLFLTSTWGDGEMPDNAVAFWDWLKGSEAPSLSKVKFSVLGLGDRNYVRFCQAGKNLDNRLTELGGTRILPLCECDTDYESASDKWISSILVSLQDLITPAAPPTPGQVLSLATKSDSASVAKLPAANSISTYSRKNPFPAPLLENHPLNAKGSSKDTRHLAFSLLGSGLEYKVGDALGVLPRNCYELVDRIILSLNCLGSEKVTLDGGEEIALRAALISKLDLRRGSERLLFNIRQVCTNVAEKRRLDELLHEDGAKARPYLAERDVLDVLMDFPQTRLDAQQFSISLAKIAPRLYSISSSPNENPGEVHLTVAVVRYSLAGRRRLGVASSFLAERLPLGMTVPVFIQPTAHFTLPKQSGIPIIMVGPGTGIAPFRAFLQERRYLADTGKNWLFFGDQHRQYDFLYSDELTAMESAGFLTHLDLAFSRDQDEKIYVQTRMLEQSKELFAWLESGAYFYVCGDAKRMAKDVEEALLQVIAKETGKGPEAARAYLETMKDQKRYQRDVY
jgi:sulfite reductase (NADPH) flavoprotein alpha-component